MRIAIDACERIGRPTGVGRDLAQLLAGGNALDEARGHDVVLCTPEPVPRQGTERLRITEAVGAGHGTLWQQFTLPRLVRDARADVLFAPAYVAPLLTRTPVVVSIHDVSFAAHPEWFGWRQRLRLRIGSTLSARKAVRILTFSEFSKREIVARLGADARKIEVTYHGVTTLAQARTGAPDSPASAPSIDGARDPGLVLFVGSLFNRRHVPATIDGFAHAAARHPHLRLEIVGHNRTRPHEDVAAMARRSPAANRIGIRSYVTDRELADCYARASAFVFLSSYEGFGMTPLEALAAGIPIVVLDTPIAREIYGDAAVYVPRPDPELIAGALEQVLFEPAERARQKSAAAVTLARYSWTDCARQTLRAIVESA
jgi:glycosyltransferase involved in cell wall biosynthesis